MMCSIVIIAPISIKINFFNNVAFFPHTNYMGYFNYHGVVKGLIKSGKTLGFKIVDSYKGISPCLLIFFDDVRRPIAPIREHRFSEYLSILPPDKEILD